MSHSTQYIGLNEEARAFAATFIPIETNNHTLGMFEEKVPLEEWQGGWKEVVQLVPWNSGPMIFTCLEKEGQRYFKWKRIVKGKEHPDYFNKLLGECYI